MPNRRNGRAQPNGLSTAEWSAVAFVYWVLFMGALAPGNISHALSAGISVTLWLELLRLFVVGALGAATAPALLALIARVPLGRDKPRRNLAAQAAAVALISFVLILISCLLAAWVLERQMWPSRDEVGRQLFANLLLLMLCTSLLLAAMQVAARLFGRDADDDGQWPQSLVVNDRGKLTVVALDTVEWIETQGNYQALHTDNATHLYRDTSAHLETVLNPRKFVRIHRKYLVARSKVKSIEPDLSGDANVVMQSGARLRQSRQHRRAFRAALSG